MDNVLLQLPLPDSLVFGKGDVARSTKWLPSAPSLRNGQEMQRHRSLFVSYLEDVLSRLWLDCAQRADFITTVLPNITYDEVLFRFLHKEEIDCASSLRLVPVAHPCITIVLLYGDAESIPFAESGQKYGLSQPMAQDVMSREGISPVSQTSGCEKGVVSGIEQESTKEQNIILPLENRDLAESENVRVVRERNTDWRSLLIGSSHAPSGHDCYPKL